MMIRRDTIQTFATFDDREPIIFTEESMFRNLCFVFERHIIYAKFFVIKLLDERFIFRESFIEFIFVRRNT